MWLHGGMAALGPGSFREKALPCSVAGAPAEHLWHSGCVCGADLAHSCPAAHGSPVHQSMRASGMGLFLGQPARHVVCCLKAALDLWTWPHNTVASFGFPAPQKTVLLESYTVTFKRECNRSLVRAPGICPGTFLSVTVGALSGEAMACR